MFGVSLHLSSFVAVGLFFGEEHGVESNDLSLVVIIWYGIECFEGDRIDRRGGRLVLRGFGRHFVVTPLRVKPSPQEHAISQDSDTPTCGYAYACVQ